MYFNNRIPHTHTLCKAFRLIDWQLFLAFFEDFGLYWLPLGEEEPEEVTARGYKRILISKRYYCRHGLDADMVNTLFHAMVCTYCEVMGIQAKKGQKYTKAFYDTAKYIGFTDTAARLPPSYIKDVQEDVISECVAVHVCWVDGCRGNKNVQATE